MHARRNGHGALDTQPSRRSESRFITQCSGNEMSAFGKAALLRRAGPILRTSVRGE
jgi:hypothetical protein